jgi:MOSC domain-containing protein YiiM
MNLQVLQSIFPATGTVEYILIRPARAESVVPVKSVEALQGVGLKDDHYNNNGGSRQVTFIQSEHLHVIGSLLRKVIHPAMTRRNIVVKGLNLLALKGKRFQIGSAILEYSGQCHPCSRMESQIGEGAYNAMRGHGGITAKVIQTGVIEIGNRVCVLNFNSGH